MNRKKFGRKGIYSKHFKTGSQSKRISIKSGITNKINKNQIQRDKNKILNSKEEEEQIRIQEVKASNENLEYHIKKTRIRRTQKSKMEKKASYGNMSMAARVNPSVKNQSSWKYKNRVGSLSRDHRKMKIRSRNRKKLGSNNLRKIDSDAQIALKEDVEFSIYTKKESGRQNKTPGTRKRIKSKSDEKDGKIENSKSVRKKLLKGQTVRNKKKSKKKITRDFPGDRRLKGFRLNKKLGRERQNSNIMKTMGSGENSERKKEFAVKKNRSALYDIGYKMGMGSKKINNKQNISTKLTHNKPISSNESRKLKRNSKREAGRYTESQKNKEGNFGKGSETSIYKNPEIEEKNNRNIYGQIGYNYDEVTDRTLQTEDNCLPDSHHQDIIYRSGIDVPQDSQNLINMDIRFGKIGNTRFYTENPDSSGSVPVQTTTNIYNKSKNLQIIESQSRKKQSSNRNISHDQFKRESKLDTVIIDKRRSIPRTIPEKSLQETPKMIYSRKESTNIGESRDHSMSQNRKLRDKLKPKKVNFPRKNRNGRSIASMGKRKKKIGVRRGTRPTVDNKLDSKKNNYKNILQFNNGKKSDVVRIENKKNKNFKGNKIRKQNSKLNLNKISFEKKEKKKYSKNKPQTNLYDHKAKHSFGKGNLVKSSQKNSNKQTKINFVKKTDSISQLRKNIFKSRTKGNRLGQENSERKNDSKADPGTEVSEGGENSLACKEQIAFGGENSRGSGILPGVKIHMARENHDLSNNQGIFEVDQNIADYSKSEDLEKKNLVLGAELHRSDPFDIGINEGIKIEELGSMGELRTLTDSKKNKKMKISSSEAGSGLKHFGSGNIISARSGDLKLNNYEKESKEKKKKSEAYQIEMLTESLEKRPMEFEVNLETDFDSGNGAKVSNKTSKIGYPVNKNQSLSEKLTGLGQSDDTINIIKNHEKVCEEPEIELQESSGTDSGEDFIIGESLPMNEIPTSEKDINNQKLKMSREILNIGTKQDFQKSVKEKSRSQLIREKIQSRDERERISRGGTLQPNYSVYAQKRSQNFNLKSERRQDETKSVQISSKKRKRVKDHSISKTKNIKQNTSDAQELEAFENLNENTSRRKKRKINQSQRSGGYSIKNNFSTQGINNFNKDKKNSSKNMMSKRLMNQSTTKDLFQKYSRENNIPESVHHTERRKGKMSVSYKENDSKVLEKLLKKCEIFKHETQNNLFEVETLNNLIRSENNYVAKADYLMTNQKFLDAKVRTVLMGWMGEVCEDLWFSRDTFHLACNYVDRFLSAKKNVTKNNLQLIGLTCLYAASKMEEVQMRCVSDYLASACNIYSEEMLKSCEIEIITLLDFRLNPPTLNMWSNWYMIQWDNFILGDSFVYDHPLVKDNPIVPQFKQGNDESYNLYREFMQYIGLKYNQFTLRQIVTEFPSSSLFLLDEDEYAYNNLFGYFMRSYFGIELIDLLPTINYASTYFYFQIELRLPTIIDYKRDEISDGHYEQLLSYQIWNKKSVAFVAKLRIPEH